MVWRFVSSRAAKMDNPEGGIPTPDGLQTNDGGDAVRPGSGTTYGPLGDVCNQTLLAFDRSILPSLSTSDIRALAAIQLRFAQAVSEQAAAAYGQMIALLEPAPSGSTSKG